MDKTYNPQSFESRIYKRWVDNGCFEPKQGKAKRNFQSFSRRPTSRDNCMSDTP